MQQFIESAGGLLPACLVLVLAMNAALTGLRTALEFIQDKTESTFDNKLVLLLAKVLGLTASLIDVLTANKKH